MSDDTKDKTPSEQTEEKPLKIVSDFYNTHIATTERMYKIFLTFFGILLAVLGIAGWSRYSSLMDDIAKNVDSKINIKIQEIAKLETEITDGVNKLNEIKPELDKYKESMKTATEEYKKINSELAKIREELNAIRPKNPLTIDINPKIFRKDSTDTFMLFLSNKGTKHLTEITFRIEFDRKFTLTEIYNPLNVPGAYLRVFNNVMIFTYPNLAPDFDLAFEYKFKTPSEGGRFEIGYSVSSKEFDLKKTTDSITVD